MQERETNQTILKEYKIKNKEEKKMRRTKQGVSLIVLVITIIIMIILASAIIITLSNSDIIERANEAVEKTDLQEVQNIAMVAWTEAYLDGKTTKAELQTAVENALDKNKVDMSKYHADVTTKGVKVVIKSTLGELISNPLTDYGKTVDYAVTVDIETYYYNIDEQLENITKNDVTLSNWQVYYEDEKNGYVYLILTNAEQLQDTSYWLGGSFLTEDEVELYSKFQVGSWPKYELIDKIENGIMGSCHHIAWMIRNYSQYANREIYGSYVVGAIGGPTIELLAANWNARGNTPRIELTTDKYGYMINGEYGLSVTGSKFGIAKDGKDCVLASPVMDIEHIMSVDWNDMTVGTLYMGNLAYYRPVICLKSDIPATYGTKTDFSLIVK